MMVIPSVIDDGWRLGRIREFPFAHQMYGWAWPDWLTEPELFLLFPIWIPLAAVALPTVLLWCRDRWTLSAGAPTKSLDSQILGLLKWIATGGCLLLAAALITSWSWRLRYTGDRYATCISAGCINFDRWTDWAAFWKPRPRALNLERHGPQTDWWRFPRRTTEVDKQFGFPLWLPILVLSIPAIFLWKLTWRRRFPTGHCQHCGYDLTGNVSGVCPECGESVSQVPAHRRGET